MKIPNNIKRLMQKLIDNDFEAYIIGGAVRDSHMDRASHDYDIFTNATGEQILEVFPNGVVLGNEERQKKILTVIVGDTEISQFRASGDRKKTGTSLYEHTCTCDFRMNAMYCNIDGEVGDYHNGMLDIKNKIINCVGLVDKRFKEDPLRMLRALRQSLQLGFAIDLSIEMYITRHHKELLSKLSVERIKDEVIKMQSYTDAWRLLRQTDILYWLIPEFEKLICLNGGQYHNEYVSKHSENAYRLSCELTSDYRIHIATKLHDIGKGITVQIDEEGKISFIGHEKKSVEIAKTFLNRFKFSNADIKYITTMIKLHMMGGVDKLSDKTIIKYVNELESAGISIEDMLIMTYCDNQGNEKQPRCKFNEFYQNNNWLKKVYQLKYQKMPFKITDLEVDGKDFIAAGIIDGKTIGEGLKKLYDFVQNGDLKNERNKLMCHIKNIKDFLELKQRIWDKKGEE